jgi:hypothetical protein
MNVYFAQDNLFNNTTTGTDNTTVTTATGTPSSVGNGTSGLDILTNYFSDDNIKNFLLRLNSFTLAWCIFYSVLFVADFFFYRMRFTDGDIAREKIGVQSLRRAFNIWFSYLFCWLGLVAFSFFPILGVIVIVGYFFKLLSVDLPMVLDIIHDYVGLNGVHTNYKKIVAPIIKLLKFDFKK